MRAKPPLCKSEAVKELLPDTRGGREWYGEFDNSIIVGSASGWAARNGSVKRLGSTKSSQWTTLSDCQGCQKSSNDPCFSSKFRAHLALRSKPEFESRFAAHHWSPSRRGLVGNWLRLMRQN